MSETPDDQRSEQQTAPQPRRGVPWFLLLFWALFACVAAGLTAEVARLESLWGGGNRFMEYAVPVPLGWGLLHWPGLVTFALLLSAAYRHPGRWLALVRMTCVGIAIGAALALYLFEVLRGFPLVVYFLVDSATALIASAFILTRAGTPFVATSWRARGIALLGPAALVMSAAAIVPWLLPRYDYIQSETVDLGPGRDVVHWWFYLRCSPGEAAAECPHLAALANRYRNHFAARRDRERHRMILLFKSREDYRRAKAQNAWVTYTWWPDGRESCSADPKFRP